MRPTSVIAHLPRSRSVRGRRRGRLARAPAPRRTPTRCCAR
ncbi:hypothetical protein ACFPRL_33500 [Pseudoclavibacter helvolus]